MSSKSSTSNPVTNQTRTDTTNENISGIDDSQVLNADGDISILDGGAVSESLEFADSSTRNALDFGTNTINEALGFGADSLDRSSNDLETLLDFGSGIVDKSSKALSDVASVAVGQAPVSDNKTSIVTIVSLAAVAVFIVFVINNR